jgi:hypothetical protein
MATVALNYWKLAVMSQILRDLHACKTPLRLRAIAAFSNRLGPVKGVCVQAHLIIPGAAAPEHSQTEHAVLRDGMAFFANRMRAA